MRTGRTGEYARLGAALSRVFPQADANFHNNAGCRDVKSTSQKGAVDGVFLDRAPKIPGHVVQEASIDNLLSNGSFVTRDDPFFGLLSALLQLQVRLARQGVKSQQPCPPTP